MKTDIFINELLKNNYKEFSPNKSLNPYVNKAYQKRIKDKKGTKYFITCYYYSSKRSTNINIKDSFEFHLQFNQIFKGKSYTINITVFSISDYINNEPNFYPLNEIEEMIEELFQKQKFEYYD